VIVDLTEKSLITVLHVDDELSLLEVTKQCLEMEGQFQVDEASSVEEAVRKLGEEAYDVVVSDYQMPGKDGLEFLKELRQKGNRIPFILFTGKGREEVAIKALNLGADQYLNKVGDPETVYGELAHSIRRAVERKRAQKIIEESEEKYKNLFELAPDGILTLNFDGVITSCNTNVMTMSGYSKEEIVGKRFSELSFIPSEEISAYVDVFASLVKGEAPKPLEATWRRKNGALCVLEFRIGFIKENGRIVGIESIARDITDRRKMEEALKDSEERFRAIGTSAKDGVILIDSEGRISFWNPAAESIFGYTKEEAVGKEIFSFLIPQRFQAGMSRALQKFIENGRGLFVGKTIEITSNRKDGTEFPAELSLSAFQMKGKWHAVGIVRDLTERKKIEEGVKESEQKLRSVVYGSPISAFFIGRDHKVVYWNRALEKYSGLKAEEVIGTDQHWKAFYKEKRPCMADLILDEAVEQIPVWYSGKFKKSELVEGGYEATDFFPSLGKKGVWLYFTAVAIRDSEGSVIGALETLEDVTERKLKESPEK
jgi:PAS domain S-box-containing protein